MADELPQQEQANLIDAIASNRMGVEPQNKPSDTEPKTPTEEAVAEGSPETEGDKMEADPVVYEIEIDGETVKLNPQQIAGTMKRYKQLNYENQQNANVLKVVQAAIKAGVIDGPDSAARFMLNELKAQMKNPQMGDTDGKTNVQVSQEASKDAMTQWEEDNALPLPPGYKQTQEMLQQITGNMGQMQKLLAGVLQQGQQAAQAGANQAMQGRAMKGDAIRQQINNNLDRGAGRVGLDESNAQDFMIFAYERGYTEDDFIDPNLTMRVMNDYKNQIDSPEMARLRDIHQRRQAFTGTVAQTPQAGDTQGATEETGDPTLDRLTQRAMG